MIVVIRAKLSEKKLTEYKTKLDEFNKNLVTIEDKDIYPEISKRILSMFNSESAFRNSKKVDQLLNGRFNPGKLFTLVILIPLISLLFLIFDGVHDICTTNLFPGSNFVKYFAYLVVIAIFGAKN